MQAIEPNVVVIAMHGFLSTAKPVINRVKFDLFTAIGDLDAHEGSAATFPRPEFHEQSSISSALDLFGENVSC